MNYLNLLKTLTEEDRSALACLLTLRQVKKYPEESVRSGDKFLEEHTSRLLQETLIAHKKPFLFIFGSDKLVLTYQGEDFLSYSEDTIKEIQSFIRGSDC